MFCQIVLWVVFGLVLALLGYLLDLGVFSPVYLVPASRGPYRFVYLPHLGAYKETGEIFDTLKEQLEGEMIDFHVAVGVYLDNPEDVGEENCRSLVGFVIKDDKTWNAVKDSAFHTAVIPERRSIVVPWKMKNMIGMLAGIFRVYPELAEFAETDDAKDLGFDYDNWGLSVEMYDEDNQRMEFVSMMDCNDTRDALWEEAKAYL